VARHVRVGRILLHDSVIVQAERQLAKRLGEVLVSYSSQCRIGRLVFGPLNQESIRIEEVKRHLGNGAEY